MKKVYSVAVILLALWAPSLKAQCIGASVATPVITSNNCFVIVQNSLPNAQITVLNSSGQNITLAPIQFTSSAGSGFAFYNCNSSPSVVFTSAGASVCISVVVAPIFLPIKVKSFTAHTQNDNSVLLRWASALESNSYQYVIQKSLDGRTFSDIGDLKAAGNSLETINYSFSDRQMVNGGVYYRLKLVDLDGSVDYTKIIYINNGKVSFGELSIFPNPFRSEVQLKGVTSSDVNRKNVRIYDAMGKEIAYRLSGANSITIDPALPKGVYILRVKGEAFKLFKE